MNKKEKTYIENFTKETFSMYKENESLMEANVFHLYDTGKLAGLDKTGFNDSRHFTWVAYNTETRECRHIEGVWFDGMDIIGCSTVKIFVDGSVCIKTWGMMKIDFNQCPYLEKVL